MPAPRFFASRYRRYYKWAGARGIVYSARVSPEHILGVFERRKEKEIVVAPSGLRNVRRFPTAKAATEEE